MDDGIQGASGVQGAGADDNDRRAAYEARERQDEQELARALSGDDGAKDQIAAYRQIAQQEAQELQNNTTYSSSDGSVIQGGDGHFTVSGAEPERVWPQDNLEQTTSSTTGGRRFWKITDSTDYSSGTITPKVLVDPAGATVRPDFTFNNKLTIAAIDTVITLVAGSVGYLELDISTDPYTLTMVFGTAWSNDEPFGLASNVPTDDMYYPIFECTTYSSANADDAALNFEEQNMQVFDLADDSGLVVANDYWVSGVSNKAYVVKRLVSGPNDFS